MMKNKTFIISIFAVILVVGYFLIYQKKDTSEQSNVVSEQSDVVNEQKTLRLVFVEGIDDLNLLLDFTKDNNFFTKNGLEVQMFPVVKQPANMLMLGEADAMIGGISKSISLYASGQETRLLASIFEPFSFFGISRFPEKEIKSIKKAIVTTFGGENQMTIISGLKNMGIDPEQVEFVAVPGDAPKHTILKKGDADYATFHSEIFLTEINARENYYVIDPHDVIKGSGLVRGVTTTQKTLEEKPEELKSFILAIYESMEYMSNNSDEVIAYIKEKYELTDDRASDLYKRFSMSRENVNFVPDIKSVKNLIDFVESQLEEESNRNFDEYLYPNFATDAIDSLN